MLAYSFPMAAIGRRSATTVTASMEKCTAQRCYVVAAPAISSHQTRRVRSRAQPDRSVWSTATTPASPTLAISGVFVQWLDPHLPKQPLSASQTAAIWTTAAAA